MDVKNVFLVLFLTTSPIWAQDYGYLVDFELSLREEKIPAIINFLLNNSLEVHDIKTEDIIKLSKLDKYDYDSTLQVFNYFNISSREAFTVDNLEKFLNIFNIDFGEFFRLFTTKLQLSPEQTQQILHDLSIPDTFWMGISLSNNDRIYSDLRQGIYDEEHVSAALKTAGKNRNEVYNASRDVVLVKILQLNSSAFVGILKEQGWNQRVALRMYEALNITTRDVYEVDKFRNIFENITNDLNANKSLGVFVGPNQLAVHDLVYKKLVEKVDGVTVKVEVDGLEVIMRKNSSLGKKIVEMVTVQSRSNYLEIVENYTAFENCTYVVKDGSVRAEKVEFDRLKKEVDKLSVKKLNSSEFILGNLLICGGKLYGVAGEETEKEIIFDTFYTEDSPPEEIPEPGDSEVNRGQLVSSLFGLTFNLITLVLCAH